MITPFKKIIVFDLETGGFSHKANSITEIAMVAVDMESLEIVDTFSSLIKPYVDLSFFYNARNEAKGFFKGQSVILGDKKVLKFQDQNLSVMEMGVLEPLIDDFVSNIDKDVLHISDIVRLLQDSNHNDIMKLFMNRTYSPQALDVTHITLDMLMREGVDPKNVHNNVKDFIKKHTHGSNKPIMSGHNINKFDNVFLEHFFKQHNDTTFNNFTDRVVIDTIEWARLRFFESGSYALGPVCNELDITLKGAHRALADTESNAKFLIKLLKSMRGEGQGGGKKERKIFKFNVDA